MASSTTTYTVIKKILGTVYTVVVSNFSDVVTWVLNIRGRPIHISAVVSALLAPVFTIRGRRPVFTTSTKLEQRPIQTIKGRRPVFLTSIKTQIRPIQIIAGRVPFFTTESELTLKPTQTIQTRPISFSFTPIIGDINILEDFDSETLGTLDVLTLEEMDYTAT